MKTLFQKGVMIDITFVVILFVTAREESVLLTNMSTASHAHILTTSHYTSSKIKKVLTFFVAEAEYGFDNRP